MTLRRIRAGILWGTLGMLASCVPAPAQPAGTAVRNATLSGTSKVPASGTLQIHGTLWLGGGSTFSTGSGWQFEDVLGAFKQIRLTTPQATVLTLEQRTTPATESILVFPGRIEATRLAGIGTDITALSGPVVSAAYQSVANPVTLDLGAPGAVSPAANNFVIRVSVTSMGGVTTPAWAEVSAATARTALGLGTTSAAQFGTITVPATGAQVYRVLSATVSWDPPSLAPGASATTTLAVSGSRTADEVAAHAPALPAGLIPYGWVSADGTVTVRVTNASTTTIDDTPRTYRAVVTGFTP